MARGWRVPLNPGSRRKRHPWRSCGRQGLRLEPATLLRVQVRDKSGAPSPAVAYCVRSDNADFTWMRDWYRAVASGEQAIGPVPPGDYALWAEVDGAVSEVKFVAPKGEPEVLVDLVL